VYRGRRRRALLVALLTLALAYAGLGAARRLLGGSAQIANHQRPVYVSGQSRTGGSVGRWPVQGQAAFVLGSERPSASPHERPAPIASLAKVMTAYLTLERYPLSGAQAGFTITVTAADAQAATDDVSQGESVVAVHAGDQLTERQLLEALLIPSGNNIAQMLADQVAGSESGFVSEMNTEARALGMTHTIYTDPSGFDPGTVSTAADQLRVFRQAMRSPAFRQIVSMYSVTLPVAGTLRNFNPLVADGYAGKTGSDSAAEGCLAFFTPVTVGGRRETAIGVVMGQGQGSNTVEILAAAGQAAERLVASATHATSARLVAASRR
jgi:serine-type D-Ala-D-Ala carboxypeptidase (penicillin-binding protein 5/6)